MGKRTLAASIVFLLIVQANAQIGAMKLVGNGTKDYSLGFGAFTPNYVAGPTDNMNFNITSYKDGHISGNFSGQLTPIISQQNYPNNVYGTYGSVLIKNGSFNNVPIGY